MLSKEALEESSEEKMRKYFHLTGEMSLVMSNIRAIPHHYRNFSITNYIVFRVTLSSLITFETFQ